VRERDTQRCVRVYAGIEFKTSYCRLSRPFCSVDRAPEEHTVCVCKFHLFFVEPSLIRQVSFSSKLILDHPQIKLTPYFFGGRHYFFEKHRPKVDGPNVTARCLPRLHPHALSFTKGPLFFCRMLMPKKTRLAIYEFLFKEGVMVAKKDFHAPKHPELETISNLHVIKAMQVCSSDALISLCNLQ
jgi:Plectin/S10 domain